ncbi:hypothetical protein MKW92_045345, partial [Papaver armeniacum]
MKGLSNLFTGDLLTLGARLAYAISSYYQRKIFKLEQENAKLKNENSTNSRLIRRARERNDELI